MRYEGSSKEGGLGGTARLSTVEGLGTYFKDSEGALGLRLGVVAGAGGSPSEGGGMG